MSTNYVILDCDGGSDDAWALLLLLKAEREGRLQLLAVTISGSGNASLQDAARNMLRILRAYNRKEVPIYLGAAEPLLALEGPDVRYFFHGKDGFGDILPQDAEIEATLNAITKSEHAVTAIQRICAAKPRQVTVMCVGPLTNIALCFALHGKTFAQTVKDIYIMGGNHQGVGNSTRAAEFNFHSDPEAAHIVLAKATECPIVILPWEPCIENKFYISLDWRLDALGTEAIGQHSALSILNDVEHTQYTAGGFKTWNPCDAFLVAAFIFGEHFIRKKRQWHVTVELSGDYTRGQMVLDHLRDIERRPYNVHVVELLDAEFFKRVALWAADLETIDLNCQRKEE